MNIADFDYDLPPQFIAQEPLEQRDASRLMRLDRESGAISHHAFTDIEAMLSPGDVLALNNTRVIPARMRAHKRNTGGAVEILLLKQLDARRWQALVGGRNVKSGALLAFHGSDLECRVVAMLDGAKRIIEFSRALDRQTLSKLGEMPLPPYIRSAIKDNERYQTVYCDREGSAAAPTAGLHFTPGLLQKLENKGIKLACCTLHIGLDTFQPVAVEYIHEHAIHSEFARLDAQNADLINHAKATGRRIIAVGTTSARALETAGILSQGGDPANPAARRACNPQPPVIPFEANTELFITPGYRWRVVDALITNFHLPRSTLLMMLSAFAGRDHLLQAYETAKDCEYRFYTFGDAMFVA